MYGAPVPLRTPQEPPPAPFQTWASRFFLRLLLSPQALLQVYRDLHGSEPPAATLLAIRGEHFELGQPPGKAAMAHLGEALAWARNWLAAPAE